MQKHIRENSLRNCAIRITDNIHSRTDSQKLIKTTAVCTGYKCLRKNKKKSWKQNLRFKSSKIKARRGVEDYEPKSRAFKRQGKQIQRKTWRYFQHDHTN